MAGLVHSKLLKFLFKPLLFITIFHYGISSCDKISCFSLFFTSHGSNMPLCFHFMNSATLVLARTAADSVLMVSSAKAAIISKKMVGKME